MRRAERWSVPWTAAYVAVACLFVWAIARWHQPPDGFTTLACFGEVVSWTPLPELEAIPHHVFRRTPGYDGQFYAQVAMRGDPSDPVLHAALDNPAYRLQRAVLPLVVHRLAGGAPDRALTIYCVVNLACWLALAVLLLRWFPPRTLHDFVCWSGVLFSPGLLVSVTRALTDGPLLLVVAAGMALFERARTSAAVAMFALAALLRETGVLAAAVLLPLGAPSARAWGRTIAAAVAIALPVVAWACWIRLGLGIAGHAGGGNLGWPAVGWVERLVAGLPDHLKERPSARTVAPLLALLSVALQVAFVVRRARAPRPWWLLGVAFAGLGTLLGAPVWAGHPTAATRVLLPLLLAVHVLAPRSREGLLLLLAVDLGALYAPAYLAPP